MDQGSYNDNGMTPPEYTAYERMAIGWLTPTELNAEQQAFITQLYHYRLSGATTPLFFSGFGQLHDQPDEEIFLAVQLKEGKPAKKRAGQYALIDLPVKEFGRFVRLRDAEGRTCLIFLDDVVRYCLPLIFIGFKPSTFEAYSFKFTKDAEMEMENDFDYGVLQKIAKGVNSRRHGDPVRLIYDKQMPKDMRKKLMSKIDVSKLDASLASSRYQNHRDLMGFPDCGHEELKFPKWKPIMKPEFLSQESILDQIRRKDLFIHVPYHSFDGYIRVLREAALKPEVKSIKTTLYRLAKDSKVVKALICAARNGKKVTAVVELLARFDEESNIKWSKRMQEEGINVIFGVEGLKIHSKLLYIESKQGNIACIGTGNFHEGNAKTYTDYLMMTARKNIVQEVKKVFDFIDRPFSQVRFKELMVSPNSMKNRILSLINNEIKNARAGREAWIRMKINHITELDVVNKLYAASAAGVKIGIVLRGNCSLVTGVPGVSDNIKAVGIIDRYLEHSRILIFCNGGAPKYYIGSADWMPRNLLNRIEVMTPVYDADMQRDLMRTVEYGLKDSTNGRIVDGSGMNVIQAAEGDRPFRSQEELHNAYEAEAAAASTTA